MTDLDRRKFIKHTGAAAGLIATSSWSSHAVAQPLLSEDDPIAIALGYKADAAQVDTSAYPKRAGTDGANQFCDNCALYSATSSTEGTCTAIPGKLVKGAGWCNAWIAK